MFAPDPVLTPEQQKQALASLLGHQSRDLYLTEAWAEHLAKTLVLARKAMLEDLSGSSGQGFAESAKRLLQAHNSLFVRAMAIEKPLDFHALLAELHIACAEAWSAKVPEECDYAKLSYVMAINALPCMAFVSSMLTPGYELRLVKIEAPAEAAPAAE